MFLYVCAFLGLTPFLHLSMAASRASPSPPAIVDGGNASRHQYSQTDIKVERIVHNWTIRNFSHCSSEYLENFVHLIKGDETLTWSVKVYPKGNGDNNKDFVFLCLNRMMGPTSSKYKNAGFKSRFIMRNAENKEIEMRVHPNPSHSDYVAYIKRDVLFPQISPQDVVQLTVEIDVTVDTVLTTQTDPIREPERVYQLSNDMSRLFKDRVGTDCVIQVMNKETGVVRDIAAHKAIIAARSSVLAAMLAHDTEESQKNCMQITDLDFDVVYEMLEYIYSGTSPRLAELAAELLVAADKYSLPCLKLQCEHALVSSLTSENAAELFILACLRNAPQLRARTLEFFTQHSFQVTHSSGWQILLEQHPQLVAEIVQHFSRPSSATSPSTTATEMSMLLG